MLVPVVTLWQAPHTSAPGVTHDAAPVLPRPLLWQYRLEHVAVPAVYAAAGLSPSNLTSATLSPSRWPGASRVSGTVWQEAHWISRCHVDGMRCAVCAPTPRVVAAVLPSRSFGGAELVAEPWHDVQPPVAPGPVTSMMPLMWLDGSRNVIEPASIVGWHDAQLPSAGCGAGGGRPWQLPQVTCEPSTRVQVGVG